MVDLCAPCNLTIQIINGIIYVNAHFKEKSAFWKALPSLLERLRAGGDLELFPASGPNTADAGPSSWIMTDRGLQMALRVYDDIRMALEYFGVPPETQAIIGLRTKVVVHGTKNGSPKGLRKRIGANWPPQIRERILQDKTLNPFLSAPNFKRIGRFRLAMGLIRKASRSERYTDLFMARLLALAQLCGVTEINFKDLQELAVHGHYYEKLARGYIAMVIGNIDKSMITNLSFGNILNKGPIGSTENVESGFADAVPKMTGTFVQLGVVQGGTVVTTWPTPSTELPYVQFRIPKDSQAKEGEPIYMLSGWAASLAMRGPEPPPGTAVNSQGLWVVQRDIHGSPMYLYTIAVSVTIKRVADGRLVAKPSSFGWRKSPKVTGQGVFGRPCDCSVPAPNRRLDISLESRFNGVVLTNLHEKEGYDFTFHDLNVVWSTGDMIANVEGADRYANSTYIQVSGECVYCAVDRALGSGCSFLMAGGGRRPKAA
ncbi:uncharacterized protein DNG_06413 [Cephalotrichum gorgonifer]|uniref:Uncharacterized protein n=1 Tax=Cephalotrichum gorgonifer TaxID=2041049 RepID=A0AAE8N2P3_9PEZI|nr:uncharacterized protein DNG_06413 [Cephalotrichum gorgonifer]